MGKTNIKLPSTRFLQANLRKMTTATANILKDLTSSTVLLLTEPYVNKRHKIPSIPKSHKVFQHTTGRPRSAIITPTGLYDSSMRLGHFSTPDITTIRVTLDTTSFIICSAYLDITLPVSNPKLLDLLEFCNQQKIPLLLGSDTNSRNTLWGDRLTNSRGKELANIIATFSLHIINKGSAPTYQSKLGSSIIDLTLVNDYALNLIKDWSSSFDKTVSDHSRLTYFVDLVPPVRQPYRSPKDCDWNLFRESIAETIKNNPFRYRPHCEKQQLNQMNNYITDTISKAYNIACPIKFTSIRSSVPWWSMEITAKRKQIRIMHRKARRHKTDHLWNLYKEGLKEYKNLIKTAKRTSWKNYVNKISSIPSASRLHKVLKSLDTNNTQLGSLKQPNGKCTSSPQDTLTTLADALLPNDNPKQHNFTETGTDHTETINKLVTLDRLKKSVQICHQTNPRDQTILECK